jgi:protein TonB
MLVASRDLDEPRVSNSHVSELVPARVTASYDPLTRIFSLMERERRVGLSIGLAGALIVHGAGAAHGYSALLDIGAFAAAVRSAVDDDVRATVAVEVNKPPPPPPPTPEPEPEKPQPQVKAPAAPQNQAQEKPPAPAQAAKVLTADPDPSEPLDLTDQGFVSGEGERFAGGVTTATGTSKTAVRDTNAKPGGVVGGKGTGPVAPAAPKEDLSRPATPATRSWDDCGFPAEADVEQIDFMRVTVVVTVNVDGRAQSVSVLKDPGYGFGNQARQCALRKTYNVGYNADGKPVVTTTPPFVVTFRR